MSRIAALALAFGVGEWLRATLFTGFPWNAIGYGAMPATLPHAILGHRRHRRHERARRLRLRRPRRSSEHGAVAASA